MQTLQTNRWTGGIAVFSALAVAVVGGLAAWRFSEGLRGDSLPGEFRFAPPAAPEAVESSWREVERFPIDTDGITAWALDPQGSIWIAAGSRLIRHDGAMVTSDSIRPPETATALAVALPVAGAEDAESRMEDTYLFVGCGDQVVVLHGPGFTARQWKLPGWQTGHAASIAVDGDNVFVADSGNGVVWRFDRGGNLKNEIRSANFQDPSKPRSKFWTPREFFPIAVAADEVLRVAHTGALCVETYTYDGDPLTTWGEGSSQIEGFYGCCNPCRFALLPDGGYVTAEKGVARVKVYSPTGEFESLVHVASRTPPARSEDADGDQDEAEKLAARWLDVATDAAGRVYVLDPQQKQIRIFEALPQ